MIYARNTTGTVEAPRIHDVPQPEKLFDDLPWWMSPLAVVVLVGLIAVVVLIMVVKVKITNKMSHKKPGLPETKTGDKAIIEVVTVAKELTKEKDLPVSPTSENVRQRKNSFTPHDSSTMKRVGTCDMVQSPAARVRTPPRLAEEGVADHDMVRSAMSAERKKRRAPARPNTDNRGSPDVKQYRSRPPKGQQERTPGKTLRKVKSDPYHIREPLYMGPIELKKAAQRARSAKQSHGQALGKVSSAPTLGSAPMYSAPLPKSPRELPCLDDSTVCDSPVQLQVGTRNAPFGGDTSRNDGSSVNTDDNPLRSGFKGRNTRKLQEDAGVTSAGKPHRYPNAGESKSFSNPVYDSFDVCDPYKRAAQSNAADTSGLYGPGVAHVLEERPVYIEHVESIYENVDPVERVDDRQTDDKKRHETHEARTKKRRSSNRQKRHSHSQIEGDIPVEYAKVQKGRRRSVRKEREEAMVGGAYYENVPTSNSSSTHEHDDNIYEDIDVLDSVNSSGNSKRDISKLDTCGISSRSDASCVDLTSSSVYEIDETLQ